MPRLQLIGERNAVAVSAPLGGDACSDGCASGSGAIGSGGFVRVLGARSVALVPDARAAGVVLLDLHDEAEPGRADPQAAAWSARAVDGVSG